jgi:hypothetical protein
MINTKEWEAFLDNGLPTQPEPVEPVTCYKVSNRYVRIQGRNITKITAGNSMASIIRVKQVRSMDPYYPYVEENEEIEIITHEEFCRVFWQEVMMADPGKPTPQTTVEAVQAINASTLPVHSFSPINGWGI